MGINMNNATDKELFTLKVIDENTCVVRNEATHHYARMSLSEAKQVLADYEGRCKVLGDKHLIESAVALDNNSARLFRSKFERFASKTKSEYAKENFFIRKWIFAKTHLFSGNQRITSKKLFFVALICLLLVLGMSILPFHFVPRSFIKSLSTHVYTHQPFFIAAFVAIAFASIIFHEAGHALAFDVLGGESISFGVMLFYFLPAPFCDVSESYFMADRYASPAIALMGPCFSGIAALVCSAASVIVFPYAGEISMVLAIGWALNISATVFNLLPILRLDGYWIASGLLGVQNLYSKSQYSVMNALIWHKKDEGISASKQRLIAMYGFVQIICQIVFIISFVSAVGSLFGVFGAPSEFVTSFQTSGAVVTPIGLLVGLIIKTKPREQQTS